MHFLSHKSIYLNNYKTFNLLNFRVERTQIDFVIIGSGKCGTTSLYEYLDQHPRIFMTKPAKEPHFFWPDKNMKEFWLRRNVSMPDRETLFSKYMMKGYAGQKIIGEASTGYTSHFEECEKAPAAMLEHNADMKLLYLIRNPHERIVSHYRQDRKMGRANHISFIDFVTPRIQRYTAQSLYGKHLENFLKYFDRNRIHVTILEKLILNPEEELSRITDFLGVKPLRGLKFRHSNKGLDGEKLQIERSYSEVFLNSVNAEVKQDYHHLTGILGYDIEEWDLDTPFTTEHA